MPRIGPMRPRILRRFALSGTQSFLGELAFRAVRFVAQKRLQMQIQLRVPRRRALSG